MLRNAIRSRIVEVFLQLSPADQPLLLSVAERLLAAEAVDSESTTYDRYL